MLGGRRVWVWAVALCLMQASVVSGHGVTSHGSASDSEPFIIRGGQGSRELSEPPSSSSSGSSTTSVSQSISIPRRRPVGSREHRSRTLEYSATRNFANRKKCKGSKTTIVVRGLSQKYTVTDKNGKKNNDNVDDYMGSSLEFKEISYRPCTAEDPSDTTSSGRDNKCCSDVVTVRFNVHTRPWTVGTTDGGAVVTSAKIDLKDVAVKARVQNGGSLVRGNHAGKVTLLVALTCPHAVNDSQSQVIEDCTDVDSCKRYTQEHSRSYCARQKQYGGAKVTGELVLDVPSADLKRTYNLGALPDSWDVAANVAQDIGKAVTTAV